MSDVPSWEASITLMVLSVGNWWFLGRQNAYDQVVASIRPLSQYIRRKMFLVRNNPTEMSKDQPGL